jgi:hypothetical protein
MSIDAFLTVHGHLYDCEGRCLQKLAEGKKVLEIGTHHGRSAIAMAATACHVTTIDHYQGDGQIGAPSLQEASYNIENSGLANKITQVVADWTKWIAGPVDLEAYDMVFYDGSHVFPIYEKHFLNLCDNFTGLIAVHDCYKQDPGMVLVTQSIEEFAKRTGRKINKPVHGTSIAWFDSL